MLSTLYLCLAVAIRIGITVYLINIMIRSVGAPHQSAMPSPVVQAIFVWLLICTFLPVVLIERQYASLLPDLSVSTVIEPTHVARPPPIDEQKLQDFARVAINNTLVVVPVNSGMLYWVDNLLCSLRRNTNFDIDKILFWALDEKAQETLDQRGHVTYRDPSLFSISANTNLRGVTPDYKRMMRERPKFFIDMLSTGYDMLMIDADTVWYQSPLLLRDEQVDAVFSTDSREWYQEKDAFMDKSRRGEKMPPVCGGLFWMKSSEKTIKLYEDMRAVFESKTRKAAIWRHFRFQDDQRGMDCLLNDGRARLVETLPGGITPHMLEGRYDSSAYLDVRLADQTMVVNGQLIKNRARTYEKNLEALRAQGKDKISVHLNWSPTRLSKERGARQMGLWYLDENGQCRL